MSYSRDAQALALTHGAEESAIDALRQRETLLQILTDANIEKDICEDVVDACEISSLNALALASGLMDTATVADLCYLTTDEADVRSLSKCVDFILPSRRYTLGLVNRGAACSLPWLAMRTHRRNCSLDSRGHTQRGTSM